ncbi:MAG: DNA polymerase IV [Candidatus Omnitrophota bacterium]|jgi:nucleotidyltransferase/DNA polymerase involved in DNA repair
MGKSRYIVHVDMDAFFASVEQRDNPAYRGKPVIVGADPKSGHGRGVVSTCSYEARKFGVHSAMPISTAYRKCPGGVFLLVDMEKYSRASRRIFAIFGFFSPRVEGVSIDEAFLDISDTYQLWGSPMDTCRAIKERIRKETGLTASVGLAPTKMAAKIASGLRKPDGLVEVTEEKLLDFLHPLDVGKLWGVGAKTQALLNSRGIETIGDLAKKSREDLKRLLGKNGEWLWEMARGIDTGEVETEREAKSIGNETTFEKDTRDREEILVELSYLCEQVSDRLRADNFKCRTVTLKIRFENFETHTKSLTLDNPTSFPDVLIMTIGKLFAACGAGERKVRLVGVKASNLSCADELTLFPDKNDARKEKLGTAVSVIRGKFGSDSILRASSKKT